MGGGFVTAFSSLGLFAASSGLAAPLPPSYISATQGANFALFNWPSPFNTIAKGDTQKINANNTFTGVQTQSFRRGLLGRSILQGGESNGTGGAINGTQGGNSTGNATSTELGGENYGVLARAGDYAQQVSDFLDNEFTTLTQVSLEDFLCVLFWVTLLLTGVALIHVILHKKLKRRLPGPLRWPQLELVIIQAALVGWTTFAVKAIVEGNPTGKAVGYIALIGPIVFLTFATVVLYVHVLQGRTVRYVAKPHELRSQSDDIISLGTTEPALLKRTAKPVLSRIRNFTAPLPMIGQWEATNPKILDRYGIFFEEYAGPVERETLPSFKGEDQAELTWHERIGNIVRPMFKVIELSFAVVVAILLAAYGGSESSWMQVILLCMMQGLLLAALLVFKPYREAKENVFETIKTVCEFIPLICSLIVLSRAASDAVRGEDKSIGTVMVICGFGGQGVFIISIAVGVLPVIPEGFRTAKEGIKAALQWAKESTLR